MYVPAARHMRALRRAGLGQAICPSSEQLMGITDCTDPCQANYGACAAAVPGIPALPLMPAGTGTSSPAFSQPLITAANALPSTSLTAALPWILGGVGLILLMGVVSGR